MSAGAGLVGVTVTACGTAPAAMVTTTVWFTAAPPWVIVMSGKAPDSVYVNAGALTVKLKLVVCDGEFPLMVIALVPKAAPAEADKVKVVVQVGLQEVEE